MECAGGGVCRAEQRGDSHARAAAPSASESWSLLPRTCPCRPETSPDAQEAGRSSATSARTSRSSTCATMTTGQGRVRTRLRRDGHEVRGRRAATGVRRQGRDTSIRARRRRCRAWSGSFDSRSHHHRPAFKPLGGVAVVARNTWAAIAGPQEAQDHLDRRHPTRATTPSAIAPSWRRPCKRPGKVVRTQGNAVPRAGAWREARDRGLLHPPPRARARWNRRQPSRCSRMATVRHLVLHPESAGGTRETRWRRRLGIPVENVIVNVTLLGAGSAGNRSPTTSSRRRCCAREMGAPVKVMWTREDDIQHDFFHTVAAEHLEGVGRCERQGLPRGCTARPCRPSVRSSRPMCCTRRSGKSARE